MAKEGFRGRQGTDLKGCVVHGFYSEFNGKSLLLSRNDIIQFTLFCIDSRERERKGEREREICCSTYLCIHWLILVYALTGD